MKYVITGSGVAGAALAWKILRTEPGADILVLEAGKKLRMRDFAIFQNYLATGYEPYSDYWDRDYPQRDQEGENRNVGKTTMPLRGARLLMYGGSTVHWGGWSFRLKPEDFYLRRNTGEGIDWPFDYDALEPYYGEAEHYIGVSGDSRDKVTERSLDYPFKAFPYTLEDGPAIRAFEKLKIGYSHLPIARQGVSHTISSHAPCQATGTCKYCPFGARYVAANSLDDLDGLEGHPNLTVRTEIVVERIVMDSKRRARGVQCHDRKTGRTELIEADCVIVASGGIESPKLLQRSVSDFWPKGVGNDADLVGSHLITHPYFIYEATMPADPGAVLQPEMGFPTLVSRHFDSEKEQKAGKYILVNPPENPKYSVGETRQADLGRLMQAGYSREEIDEALRGDLTMQLHGIVEVFSRAENSVTNGSRTNRMGLLDSVVNYTKDAGNTQREGFDKRMDAIGRQVGEVFRAMGAAPAELVNVSWRADHAACTTRMSDDPAQGVVDGNLKVHGTDNVYVCSNASFATLGAVNPTLTLAALALRLGDHLLGRAQDHANAFQPAPGDLALAPVA